MENNKKALDTLKNLGIVKENLNPHPKRGDNLFY
jgi:hypothetical protein